MKKFLVGLGVVVALLVVAALVAPLLIPVDAYKRAVVAQIEAATGRKAQIAGDFHLSLLPNIEFEAGKVSLANLPGRQPADMATIGKLSLRLALMPLLSGKIVVHSLVLDKPAIALSVDRNGHPNWLIGKGTTGTAAPSGGGGVTSLAKELTLGDIKLVDGTLSYSDARTSQHYDVSAVNLNLSQPSPSSALQADGSLVWCKEPVSFKLQLDRPDALLAGGSSAARVNVDARPIKLAFHGTLSNEKGLKAQGPFTLETPSPSGLASWAGRGPAAVGAGPLKLSGNAELSGADLILRQAVFSFGSVNAKGELRIDGSRPRPYLQAKLSVGRLDLGNFMAPPAPPAAPAGPPAPSGPSAPSGAAGASAGWSNAPLDLRPLAQADADLDLQLAGLTAGSMKIGASHLVVSLKGGKLVADFRDMALYGGRGRAKITLDGSGSVPGAALDAQLSGLQLAPFLGDAFGMTRLEGTANATIAADGRGASQRAIVASLHGKGELRFRDGAIRGINLAAMVRNIKTAFLDPAARREQKTDFSELGGTYTISNGILSNSDLELKSPLLRATGRGTANLVNRTVDYRIEPKLVASTIGQGGRSDLAGIMVPVIVTGSWDDLHYQPDLAAAIGAAARGKLRQELEKVVPRGLPKGAPGGIPGVPGLGGSGSGKPADLLKGLLGR